MRKINQWLCAFQHDPLEKRKSFKKRDWAFDFVGHSKAHELSGLLASGENIGLDVEMMLDLYLFGLHVRVRLVSLMLHPDHTYRGTGTHDRVTTVVPCKSNRSRTSLRPTFCITCRNRVFSSV